jgi:hypothetical protein
MPTESVPIESFAFHGLIGDLPWPRITGPEFFNALAKIGWREAHNAHIFKRLCERGPGLGINTPNDFARALRNGHTLPTKGGALQRVCQAPSGSFVVIYREQSRSLITIVHQG